MTMNSSCSPPPTRTACCASRPPAVNRRFSPFRITAKRESIAANPHVLPGSKTVLVHRLPGTATSVAPASMRSTSRPAARKTIITAATDPAYIASGHLVLRHRELGRPRLKSASRAQSCVQCGSILHAWKPSATPVSDTEGMAMGTTGAANYSLSRRGDLVFVPAGSAGLTPRRHQAHARVGRPEGQRDTRSPRPPASTLSPAFRPTAPASRSTSATRATTSGSGTSAVRRCRRSTAIRRRT